MYYLISYDITDQKRMTKTMKFLRQYCDHVQLSVFECSVSPEMMKEILDGVLNIIDQKEDKVRVYSMCESCRKKIFTIGTARRFYRETSVIF